MTDFVDEFDKLVLAESGACEKFLSPDSAQVGCDDISHKILVFY